MTAVSQQAKPTILIVDDSAEICRFLAESVLRPEGYRVLVAHNGRDGLRLALREKPDLILLDINLPDMSGTQVLRTLRQYTRKSDIIFITSDDSLTVAIEALRMGVRDYLLKPFQVEEILRTVARVLAERRNQEARERMARDLVAVETIRRTTVTLSHRISNDLMALGGNLALLRDMLAENGNKEALPLVYESLQILRRINTTLQRLRETSSVKIEKYDQYTEMVALGNLPPSPSK